MKNYRAILKGLITAIDESEVGDDRCVVCGTNNADHNPGCAYRRAVLALEGEEREALGKLERLVADVMAKGDLGDVEFIATIGPLHDFCGTAEFRAVYREVIHADWWKAFVERHGPKILDEGGTTEPLRRLNEEREARTKGVDKSQ